MSNVPVLQSVRAAFEFRRLHWRTVGGVLGFFALASTVETAGQLTGDKGLASVGQIAGLVAYCMGYAALMRLAFADEHPGDPEFAPKPGGFQWAKPEWRLMGAFLVLVFTGFIVLALAVFACVLFVIATGLVGRIDPQATPQQIMAALAPGERAALFGLVAAAMMGGLYVFIRLALAPAATIARRKVEVFPSWKMTQGQGLRIAAAMVMVNLPALGAGVVMGLLLQAVGGAPGANGLPQAPLPIALVLGALPGLVAGFVQLPLSVGLTAYLYRGLRPQGGP